MGTRKKTRSGAVGGSSSKQSKPVAARSATARTSARKAKRVVAASSTAKAQTGEVLDAERAYEASLGEAKALAAHEVRACRTDSATTVVNVQRGTAAVLERADELTSRFTPAEIKTVRGLPARALAFSFAAAQVEAAEMGSDGSLARRLVRARVLRRLLLRGAEACADKGLVPAGEVARIREGRGPLDTAQDCVQLAALYRRHAAALAGKTPATDADVSEAATLGSELVATLRPMSATRTPRTTRQRQDATGARDRVWTLLTRDHEWLWKMGAMLWGKAVDEHVPPLQSRAATPHETAPAPAPTG